MTDALGQAMFDYYYGKKPGKLWIHNTYGPKEEMPVSAYFRDYEDMPALEQKALALCKGCILDIGAGAGSHALYLQQLNDVTALEISSLSCDVMSERGVKEIICKNVFDYKEQQFDTLLLLMNGIGLCGSLAGLTNFLQHAIHLIKPGGQLLFDSSDVAYVYNNHFPNLDHYYGEIEYRYQYKRLKSDWFKWLYIDRHTLAKLVAAAGWKMELITEDEHGQYLVRLTRLWYEV
ncbi:MAG: class I SAM-dependent methyltransferase [Chitinophagaceae bacterium]